MGSVSAPKNLRRKTAICICLSGGGEGSKYINWFCTEKSEGIGASLNGSCFSYFPKKNPLNTFQTKPQRMLLCDSWWHSNTEQLTASLMTTQTKPPPDNSTERRPQFPFYCIQLLWSAHSTGHTVLYTVLCQEENCSMQFGQWPAISHSISTKKGEQKCSQV